MQNVISGAFSNYSEWKINTFRIHSKYILCDDGPSVFWRFVEGRKTASFTLEDHRLIEALKLGTRNCGGGLHLNVCRIKHELTCVWAKISYISRVTHRHAVSYLRAREIPKQQKQDSSTPELLSTRTMHGHFSAVNNAPFSDTAWILCWSIPNRLFFARMYLFGTFHATDSDESLSISTGMAASAGVWVPQPASTYNGTSIAKWTCINANNAWMDMMRRCCLLLCCEPQHSLIFIGDKSNIHLCNAHTPTKFAVIHNTLRIPYLILPSSP